MYPKPEQVEESRRKVKELQDKLMEDSGLVLDDGEGELQIRKGSTKYVRNKGNKRYGSQ